MANDIGATRVGRNNGMTSDDVGTAETLISLRGILQMKKGFSSQVFVFHFFTILIFCRIFLSALIYMQYVILCV